MCFISEINGTETDNREMSCLSDQDINLRQTMRDCLNPQKSRPPTEKSPSIELRGDKSSPDDIFKIICS